jgi:hypothetical protein
MSDEGQSGKRVTWRVILPIYLAWTLVLLPWWIASDERFVPTLVWLVGTAILPTPAKLVLRMAGFDTNPRAWKW